MRLHRVVLQADLESVFRGHVFTSTRTTDPNAYARRALYASAQPTHAGRFGGRAACASCTASLTASFTACLTTFFIVSLTSLSCSTSSPALTTACLTAFF